MPDAGLQPARPVIAALAATGVVAAASLQFDSGFPIRFDQYLPMVGACLLMALAASRMGTLGNVFLGGDRLMWWERFLLGLLLLSLWPMFLGTIGFLTRPLAAAPICILPFVRSWRDWGREINEARMRCSGALSRLGLDEMVFLLVSVLALLWCFAASMAPPIGIDALAYHLGLADQALIRGSIRPPDAGFYHLYWQQYQMAILPLLALERSGIAVNMLGGIILLALVMGVATLAGLYEGRRASLLGAAAVVTSPIVMFLLGQTKDDLLACAFAVAAVHSCLRVEKNGSDATSGGGVFGGIMAGGALAVKPTAAFCIVPLVLALMIRRPACWKHFVIAAIPLPLFWLARSWMFGGGLLPAHASALGQSGGLPDLAEMALAVRHLVGSFFLLLERYIEGPIGPLLMIMPMFALLDRSTWRLRSHFMLGSLLALALWSFIGRGQVRFLLPLLVVAAALGAPCALRQPAWTRALVLLALLASLGAGVRIMQRYNQFLPLLTDNVDPNAYLLRWQETFLFQLVADRDLPPDAHIVGVGEHRFFYLHRRATADGYWERSRVLDAAHASHDPESLRSGLIDAGYTHLLYVPSSRSEAAAAGETPAPLCARDEEVLRRMLRSSKSYIREAGSMAGLYVLAPSEVAP